MIQSQETITFQVDIEERIHNTLTELLKENQENIDSFDIEKIYYHLAKQKACRRTQTLHAIHN